MIDRQSALIYAMVLSAAADRDMADLEIGLIGDLIRYLPAFEGYDMEKLPDTWKGCVDLLTEDSGLEQVIMAVRDALTAPQRETAYALACDVIAVNGKTSPEELQLLEILRGSLEIGRLTATAIEHCAQVRFSRG